MSERGAPKCIPTRKVKKFWTALATGNQRERVSISLISASNYVLKECPYLQYDTHAVLGVNSSKVNFNIVVHNKHQKIFESYSTIYKIVAH